MLKTFGILVVNNNDHFIDKKQVSFIYFIRSLLWAPNLI